MEDKFFYPNDIVVPVEIGDGYRDYRLSEVLSHHGYRIDDNRQKKCELHFARNEVNATISYSFLFLLAHLFGNQCIVLAPNNYWRSSWLDLRTHTPYMPTEKELETPLASYIERYVDARIRYYIQDGVVQRPVWVSVYDTTSKRFFKKDDTGKDRLVYEYSEIELCCGYEHIPYCTELLEGDLIEPDLVLYDDIVNRLLKSSFVEHAE